LSDTFSFYPLFANPLIISKLIMEAKRRFNKVVNCLDKNDVAALKELLEDDHFRNVEYYIEVTTANINKYAENISQLQEKIKRAKTDIAIWKQHLNKLKAL